MYKMDITYLKNPIILSTFGALIYYLSERFDCYINARKTSSLNRRTVVVFLILVASLYFVTMEDKDAQSEMFTDVANF